MLVGLRNCHVSPLPPAGDPNLRRVAGGSLIKFDHSQTGQLLRRSLRSSPGRRFCPPGRPRTKRRIFARCLRGQLEPFGRHFTMDDTRFMIGYRCHCFQTVRSVIRVFHCPVGFRYCHVSPLDDSEGGAAEIYTSRSQNQNRSLGAAPRGRNQTCRHMSDKLDICPYFSYALPILPVRAMRAGSAGVS
jgi:hypothetical protein